MNRQQAMEHERMRFRTMTPKQLLSRLYKITHSEKLEAYIETASRLGYTSLAEAAIAKRNGMRIVTSHTPAYTSFIQNEVIEKHERAITQEINYRRSLDF